MFFLKGEVMSIFNKMVKAIDDCNLDDYLNLLHDN